jgi:hypothetical protein
MGESTDSSDEDNGKESREPDFDEDQDQLEEQEEETSNLHMVDYL